MMRAREEILDRVRAALGAEAEVPEVTEVTRAYRREDVLRQGDPALEELLVDRLIDYKAVVLRPEGDVAEAIDSAIAQVLTDRVTTWQLPGSDTPGRVLHAPGLPQEWRPRGAEADDGAADARELDQVAAVVTGSVTAIASTGTIVLDGSPLCGRRALTLVPDVHVCVVRRDDIVETVPAGLARLDPQRPLTFISGPSATSDIELNRVEGVHGPRTLIVVLV